MEMQFTPDQWIKIANALKSMRRNGAADPELELLESVADSMAMGRTTMSPSRRNRPPKQSRPMAATVIDCGNARLIVTRLADPIGELTVCLETQETRSSVGPSRVDVPTDETKWYATVAFVLLSDTEARMLGETLGVV